MKTWQQVYEEYDTLEDRYWTQRSAHDKWRAIAVCVDAWPGDAAEPTAVLFLKRGVRFELAKRYNDIDSARFAFRHLLLESLIQCSWEDSHSQPDSATRALREDFAGCLDRVGFENDSLDASIRTIGTRAFGQVLHTMSVGDRGSGPRGCYENLLHYCVQVGSDTDEKAHEDALRAWKPGIDPFTHEYFVECWKRAEQPRCSLDAAFHLVRVKNPKGGRHPADDGRNLRIAWFEHVRQQKLKWGEGAWPKRGEKRKARSDSPDLFDWLAVTEEATEAETKLSQQTIDDIYESDKQRARVLRLWELMGRLETLQGANLPNIKSITRNPFDARNRRLFPLTATDSKLHN